MRKIILFGFVMLFLVHDIKAQYDSRYVEVSNGDGYNVVTMRRDGGRIKAKYFAAEDYNGNSVYERYKEWAAGKNTVLVTSGTYMSNCNHLFNPKPVGLCIDNGVVVNRRLSDDFDGLVIVYATGGIVVSDLVQGNLTVQWNGRSETFNLRGNYLHLTKFLQWAQQQEATVFQTHLLVYENRVQVYEPKRFDVDAVRERRFLAVCRNEFGELLHMVVHSPTMATLYDATNRVYDFLTDYREMEEVVFLINLDTGCQDVFQVNLPDGSVNRDITGQSKLWQAVNLLAYYFE